MKKLVFLACCFTMISLPVLADTTPDSETIIYCPQSITCTKSGCKNNSYTEVDFHIVSHGLKNATYFFYEAIHMDNMSSDWPEWTCQYYTKNINSRQFGLTIKTRSLIKANINYPGNNWVNTNARGNGGGVYLCKFNALHCPFKYY